VDADDVIDWDNDERCRSRIEQATSSSNDFCETAMPIYAAIDFSGGN
jgi:hypothetical protein